MKVDSDKEKTETIMNLRMKLDSQTMDLEEKNILFFFLFLLYSAVNRLWQLFSWAHYLFIIGVGEGQERADLYPREISSHLRFSWIRIDLPLGAEQSVQQALKEMAQKERDIQEMMALADEAFQQKNGSSEKMWMAKIQKQHEEIAEKEAAFKRELEAHKETISKLRSDLNQSQVANRRLSSHFSSLPEEEEDTLEEMEDFPPAPAATNLRRVSGGFALRGRPPPLPPPF